MKWAVIAGTRPNFIKVAPLIKAAASSFHPVEIILIHTGQHHHVKLSKVISGDMEIPEPHYNLGVAGGTRSSQITRSIRKLIPVLKKEAPESVFIIGDSNPCLSGALAARKLGLKLIHIEAGLRSFDRSMPEEKNRILADAASDLLLTPCRFSDSNLRREGFPEKKIICVGNIMIDALESMRPVIQGLDPDKILGMNQHPGYRRRDDFRVTGKNYLLFTLHRPGNTDTKETLETMLTAIAEVSRQVPVIFPLHPRTGQCIQEFRLQGILLKAAGLRVLTPLTYTAMQALLCRSRAVLTDSGGLQEEACIWGIPCITLRNNTERPVTLVENGGTNRLCPADKQAMLDFLPDLKSSFVPQPFRPPLWDGKTAERIISLFNRD